MEFLLGGAATVCCRSSRGPRRRFVVGALAAPVGAEKAAIRSLANKSAKKTDVAEHPKVFHHVGLLANEPPGPAGLLFI
jgi:hypothetical protein